MDADDGGCQNDPAFLIFDEKFTRRYSLPGFSSGAVPAWLPRAETPAALAALIGVDPEGLERTVAAAFWTGDAYPAPGATLGIGMTMGYIAGRHAASGNTAASLE